MKPVSLPQLLPLSMNQFTETIDPYVVARMGIHMHNILPPPVPVRDTIIRIGLLHNTCAVMMPVGLDAQASEDHVQRTHGIKNDSRMIAVAALSGGVIAAFPGNRANWFDPDHLRESLAGMSAIAPVAVIRPIMQTMSVVSGPFDNNNLLLLMLVPALTPVVLFFLDGNTLITPAFSFMITPSMLSMFVVPTMLSVDMPATSMAPVIVGNG